MAVWSLRLPSVLWGIFVLPACGSASNPFRYATIDSDRESFEYLYEKAQADFDAGRLESALKASAEALRINRRSEKAAVLYGFVNLSLAGADPFSLAKALIARSSSSESKKLISNDDDHRYAAVSHMNLMEEGGDPLAFLREAINVSDFEIRQMAEIDSEVEDLPLLIPRCVESVRQESQRLQYLNLAIIAVCPFIDEDLRVPQDYRQICEATGLARNKTNEAHFLWSFAHLTESLIFNSVLTYRGDNPPNSPTNFELRVKRLKETSPGDVARFVQAVARIQEMTDKILPINDQCGPQTPTSQLRATLLDLMAVERGFSRLSSIPNKIIEPLKKGISGVVQAGGSATNLRADFTKKISQDLSEKIDQVAAEKKMSTADVAKLCENFDKISSGNQVPSETCKK